MRRGSHDITLVERAYDLSAEDDTWLDGVHEAARPLFDRGFGMTIGTWRMQGSTFTELGHQRGSALPGVHEALSVMVQRLPPDVLARHYGPAASDFIGSVDDIWPEARQVLIDEFTRCGVRGAQDSFGMLVMGTPGQSGMVLNAVSPTTVTLTTRERSRLKRLAAHLSAGLRLRLSIGDGLRHPVAVVSPEGVVAHAEGEARSTSAREALVLAAKAIETSRGRLRRTSPEEALLLWKGLVSGRWTLVDWVDTDQRRYLVAYENPLSMRDVRALTARERDVAECLVQGRSSSEMAYVLGLSLGTISRLSRDVLRKLGVKRRTDLARLFGGIPPLRATLPTEPPVTMLTAGANPELWSRLRESEREVVSALLKGSSPSAIAQARQVSVKTVSNQLGRVYQHFGVRGRTELAALLGAP
ncbi:MAG: LuxR C-terminal-related transcriptional regulator [Myxococcaceae bacterium]|nr:LuxR C-terminal-related transcriptional regulator [Myxococcaceae bacterium]